MKMCAPWWCFLLWYSGPQRAAQCHFITFLCTVDAHPSVIHDRTKPVLNLSRIRLKFYFSLCSVLGTVCLIMYTITQQKVLFLIFRDQRVRRNFFGAPRIANLRNSHVPTIAWSLLGGCDDEKGAGGGIKMHAWECEAKLSVIALVLLSVSLSIVTLHTRAARLMRCFLFKTNWQLNLSPWPVLWNSAALI